MFVLCLAFIILYPKLHSHHVLSNNIIHNVVIKQLHFIRQVSYIMLVKHVDSSQCSDKKQYLQWGHYKLNYIATGTLEEQYIFIHNS